MDSLKEIARKTSNFTYIEYKPGHIKDVDLVGDYNCDLACRIRYKLQTIDLLSATTYSQAYSMLHEQIRYAYKEYFGFIYYSRESECVVNEQFSIDVEDLENGSRLYKMLFWLPPSGKKMSCSIGLFLDKDWKLSSSCL